jgi:hypothetical protein
MFYWATIMFSGVVQFRPFLGNRGEREPTVGIGGQEML